MIRRAASVNLRVIAPGPYVRAIEAAWITHCGKGISISLGGKEDTELIMFKTENLSRRLMIAAAMLSVLLLAVLFMGTSANAEGVDDAAVTTAVVDEYGRSADSGAVALWNVEYKGGPYFRLCLHDYQALAPDATVTVTAYIPGTLMPFYRATFTKDYLAFKDTVNLIGGVLTQGAELRLPAVCQLKIEVNGDTVDGWKLIYGTYVEEAAIWSPANMNPIAWIGEVFGSDYVYGNATCMWATNFGGHVVHLGIDGAAGGDNPGGDNPGGDNPGGDNPGGDNPGGDNPGGDNPGGDNPGGDNPGGDNPGGDNPGGDNPGGDNPGGDNPGGDNPGGDNPSGDNPGDDNPGGDNPGGDNPGGNKPDDPSTPNNPGTPDKPNTPDKPTEPKTPSKTGDTRGIAVLSAIAVISLAVLTGTYRKKRPN